MIETRRRGRPPKLATPAPEDLRTPQFCDRDGAALKEYVADLDVGFDPYTGLKLPSVRHVTRRCPMVPFGHTIWTLTGDSEWRKQ